MAASVRASGTAVFGTASTLTPTGPTNSIGDILLYWVASNSSNSTSPTHSTPSGYTLLASVLSDTVGVQRTRLSCYWRRATAANETAPSVTLTPTGATVCHHMAAVQSVQNAIASGDPYENAQTAATDGAESQAISRIISGAGRLSFLAAHHGDNVATAATEDRAETYVQHYSTDNATGIDGFTAVWSFGPLGTTSDTATLAFTGGGTAVDIAAIAFAILPSTTTHEMAGTPALVLGAAGAPGFRRDLSGAAALLLGAAGGPQRLLDLAGAPALAFALAGGPQRLVALSGAPPLAFGLAGGPVKQLDLAGSIALAFGLAGGPQRVLDLSGVSALVLGAAGEPQRVLDLAGSAALGLAATGDFTVTGGSTTHELSGAPALVFALAGGPVKQLELSGSPALSFGLAGDPQRVLDLVGSAPLVLGAAGAPQRVLDLAGAVALALAASGEPAYILNLSGVVALVFAGSGGPTLAEPPLAPPPRVVAPVILWLRRPPSSGYWTQYFRRGGS